MDIEHLTLILETINAAGDGAMTLAIWYLALQVIKPLIVCGTLLGIMIIIARIFTPQLQSCAEEGKNTSRMKELRGIVTPNSDYGPITLYEYNAIRRACERSNTK